MNDTLHASPRDTDAGSTALIVIDMQVDFLQRGGRLPVDLARVPSLVESVNGAVADARRRGMLIVHVTNAFPKHSLLNPFRLFAAIEGSAGAAIDPRIDREGAPIVPKRQADAFSNPDLDVLLRSSGIRAVVLAGVFAGGCVKATARGAVKRGYETVVLAHCVASRSERSTRRALDAMRRFGAAVA